MSSSIFIENPPVNRRSSESLEDKYLLNDEIKSPINSSDSNLVVVYGKNGMSFDRKGLENLIEEKTLSSISVIRLTSPTPSMEEEEANVERKEKEGKSKQGTKEAKGKQNDQVTDEENVDEDEALSPNDERNLNNSEEDQESELNESEASSSDSEYSTSEMEDRGTSIKKQRKYTKSNKKTHKSPQKCTRERPKEQRPEIVGLTVEEFYPPEDAKQMAKEILKLAGVSTIRRSADCEFQLYVIKNDHCYTPFTSPAQMKAKLEAEKANAEKSKAIGRKLLPQNYASVKQLLTKKKLQQADISKSCVVVQKTQNEKDTIDVKLRNEVNSNNKSKSFNYDEVEHTDDEDNLASSASDADDEEFEESDFATSELSAESENDRESDLDFDVNNRKGRKRKTTNNKIIKRPISSKSVSHKRSQMFNQENSTELNKAPLQCFDTDNTPRMMNKNISTSIKTFSTSSSARKGIQSSGNAVLPIAKKTVVESTSPSTQQTTLGGAVRRGPIVQLGTSPRNPQLSNNAKSSLSPQPIKEIVINKVIASPKGGFTDIGALLSQPENQLAAPNTPTSSTKASLPLKTTPSSKGFMPLGIETAVKNQLPSQISIQTHQSSSELAAEHDKQLDLIDSIVNDEMQKSSIIENEPGENENIPQLVKMLESTERALKSKKSEQIIEFGASSSTIDHDIDISSAPLLETPGDEIPADLLQHVVELIEDDKTLQEAVEKQVFGEDSNVAVEPVATPPTHMRSMIQNSSENTRLELRPPESPITVDSPQPMSESQGRSIIQATLFNDFTTSSPVQDGSQSTGASPSILSKNVSAVRKEPIQIVRGNGRVITLPPIEAPTTRAKRRAQAQPRNSTFIVEDYGSNTSFDTSMQSLQSFSTMDYSVLANSSTPEKKTSETPTNTRQRTSKDNSASTKASRKGSTKKSAARATAPKHETADDASDSHGDDDDPKKLWCICRQPHNNRFMICCDVCEDWFHGTCVSITKAMGLEMEQKGIDWTCPKCLKKIEEKKQRKITDMLGTRKTNPAQSSSATDSIQRQNVHIYSAPQTPPTTSSVVTNQSENLPKKQVIEIKKIQSGQFISLKNLDEHKLPLTVLTSGQKKQILPFNSNVSSANTKSGMQTPAKRVYVVQKMSGQKTDNAKKAIMTDKSPQQQQQIKSQKITTSIPTTYDSPTICSNSAQPVVSPPAAVVVQPIEPTTPCIVCKKPSRPNSIYCSDDCIRKHAQNALNAFTSKTTESPSTSSYTKFGAEDKKKKSKGLFEDLLSMADRKPKVERVSVFERKTGRFLIGNSAPTTMNLKKWLQDNPTFEVVQPGSSQANEIERRQKQRSGIMQKQLPDSNSVYSALATNPTTDDQTKESLSSFQSKGVKQSLEQTKLSSPSIRPQTPKQLVKQSQPIPQKSEKLQKSDSKDEMKPKEKSLKRQSSESNYKKATSSSSTCASESPTNATDPEPIRINVRRTLKEQLMQRINELETYNDGSGPTNIKNKPSVEYVEEFVKETELEMYNYFNRDTGAKYKAKYRSLMFNIKDRKNQTLFQKICANVIKPSQLVRMSPEELASQELAQWRENETKHQLEMIKKSELDLLSCAKNYVLKTHKGEEVIEGKSTDCVNLDITIPVEDVVSVLNDSTSSAGGGGASSKTDAGITRRDYSTSEATNIKGTYESQRVENHEVRSIEDKNKLVEERHTPISREHDKDKVHKNKERHREKSRTRRRSRSRSRSREKRHKSSSHKDDKRERGEREKDRDRDSYHSREKDQRPRPKDDHDNKLGERRPMLSAPTTPANSPLTIKPSHSHGTKEKHKDSFITSTQSKRGDIPANNKQLEAFSLIDQIIESTKTVEEAANIVTEKNKVEQQTANAVATANTVAQEISSSSMYSISQNSTDSDQEPTSTVSIISSPQDPYASYFNTDGPLSIWSGNINMIDVASFQILIQSVVGDAVNLGKLLPDELDVVGRIGPDTVWDYISKIKKSPNKEIVILRLLPACDSETMAYTILYNYLYKRNRLGVIKTNSPQIKDFYIFPLGAGNQMPPVLQPIEAVDFYEDPHRPDILVGIVIRVLGKRLSTFEIMQHQSSAKVQKFHTKLKTSDSYTPPGSPKRKRHPVSSTQKRDDIDIDAIIKAPIVSKKNMTPVVPTSTTADDQDEPYSPGCSSDEDLSLLNAKSSEYNKTAEEELKRKMDELNRQIAAQEMEIAGLLNVEPSKFLPSSGGCGTTNVLNPSLANISIPSNLSQILASIKHKPDPQQTNIVQCVQSASVPPPPLIGTLHRSRKNEEEAIHMTSFEDGVNKQETSSKSRLAQLSEAELLSMVPDDMLDSTTSSLPPPPAAKKSRYDEPPPPGV